MKETALFPLSDFLRKDNKALVHLLEEVLRLQALGDEQLLATRAVCKKAFDSRSYGLAVIKRAEKEGYLWRSEGSAKKGAKWGGGGKVRICKITEKGLQLLEQLGVVRHE